jgi:iron complex outermembrane receptor protein
MMPHDGGRRSRAAASRRVWAWAAGAVLAAMAAQTSRAQTAATLAPVIVTSVRTGVSVFDTPGSVSVIDGEDLRGALPQINLSEGLGGVPGLQIQNRQNYAQDLQISVRGFGARSTFGVRGVRLYVDGIPATLPDGQGQTSNIDIGSIDRVEVLRGPVSALYGNASGGVIQVFTQDGEAPPSLTASLSGGSFGTWRYGVKASGADAASGLDYVLDTTRFTTDGYRDHSSARKNLANAKLRWRPDDDSSVTLVLNSVDLRAQDPLGLTRAQYDSERRGAALAEQFDTRKTVRQSQGGLLYERRVDADNDLRALLYYGQRGTTQYQSIPPAAQLNPLQAGGVIDLERNYGGMDLRWTRRLLLGGRPLTLVAGLAYDELDEQRKGYENSVPGPSGPQLGKKGALRRDESNTVWNLDQYAQASWQFAEKWTLDLGLRHSYVHFASDDHYVTAANGDDSGSARYDKTLPMAALRYQATPDLNLYATAGRGFETPTLNEISYRPDNAAGLNFGLMPSTSTSIEAGAKVRMAGGLLTAAVFQTRSADEIVTASNDNGRSTFQNAGRTERNGLEFGWDARFGRDWRAQLAYTRLNARYRDGFCGQPCTSANSVPAGNRIPGIARDAFFAALGWQPREGWRAGVEARYLSHIEVDDANDDAAPGYLVTAVQAGYVLPIGHWRWSAFARVDNLLDRKYAGSVIVNESNGRSFEPAPGRNWTAGMSGTYTF